jgi:hypothetical protein
VVKLEGAEGENAVPMHSEIYVTRADNRLIYVFALSAPLDQWESVEPTFDMMLKSITILE